MIFSGSTGIVATRSSLGRRRARRQSFAPCSTRSQAEQGAPAAWADLLVVFGAVLHLVCEAELPLDDLEVAHHHRRRVRATAAATLRLVAAAARVLVEADADLRRSLEDVEQLA